MNQPAQNLPGADDTIALLGKGSKFEGKLTFEGTVRIDGELIGEVFTDDTLVIGPGGVVQAEVEVGTLVLQGHLIGNVRANSLVDLRAPGRLEGNITAPDIMMERGVFFEGTCSMAPGEGHGRGVDSNSREERGGSNRARPGQPAQSSPTLAPVSNTRPTEE